MQWFCGLEDHLFFCEINEEFIKNEFNLYGLKKRVNKYAYVPSYPARRSR